MNNRKDMVKLMRQAAYSHSLYDVFRDFCEMSALAISNSVDLQQRDEREARYLQTVKRYDKKTLALFPQMLVHLVDEFEEVGFADVLGQTFMELEIANKDAGQFFTPFELCRMMAQMQIDDSLREKVAERGFVTVNDPAVGGGATVIAFAEALRQAGINEQRQLHATVQDIDSRSAHMAYIQLSLLSIPAVVIIGNTLTMEVSSHWYTPAHILGGWNWKLRAARDQPAPQLVIPAMPPGQINLFPIEAA